MGVGPYFSLSRFWPVSWKVYVSATQFSGGISRQNGWYNHGRTGSVNKHAVRTHRPSQGAVRGELAGGEPLVAVDLDGRAEAEVEANKNGKMMATVGPALVALVAGCGNGGTPLSRPTSSKDCGYDESIS
jgi:hypothetical protein